MATKKEKKLGLQTLSKQDKVLIRNDVSMLLALRVEKLDRSSRNWLKYGR